MKTPEKPVRIHYIETARTPSPGPVRLDTILEERIKAFRRAKNLHQAVNTNK